jgi:amino acid transporter
MLVTGETRTMRLFGAMILTINAMTAAYAALSIAKDAVISPWKAALTAGLVVGAISGSYAMLSNIKKPEVGKLPSTVGTAGTSYEYGYEGLQRGAMIVTKPTFALLHPGESVSSANKPTSGGSIIINVSGDLVDHEAFLDKLERALGSRVRRARRTFA